MGSDEARSFETAMDFSLLREFRFTERIRLQVRGEFFNALNHTNLGLPGHTFGGAGFGSSSGSKDARQIQVGERESHFEPLIDVIRVHLCSSGAPGQDWLIS